MTSSFFSPPLLLLLSILTATSPLFGQSGGKGQMPKGGYSPNIVVPQQRSYAPDSALLVPIIGAVDVVTRIDNLTAVTELRVRVRHPFSEESNIHPDSRKTLTADIPFSLLIPIPGNATLRDSRIIDSKWVSSTDSAAISLPRSVNTRYFLTEFSGPDALAAYKKSASQVSNPTLLEFAGNKLIRCGNFTLPFGQACTFTLIYEEQLTPHGNRIDYVLPRSESFAFRQVPWSINVHIASPKTIAGIYSPSHPVNINQFSATGADVEADAIPLHSTGPRRIESGSSGSDGKEEQKHLDPGPFRLSWMIGNELSASFIACPQQKGEGGNLMLLAGTPPLDISTNKTIRREVILVIDRSGSMQGEKMEQVRTAALKILDELNEEEAFNIVDYADSVAQFAPQPVIKDERTLVRAKAYVQEIKPDGGTNIHDALTAALTQSATPDYLPLVIFLTDGLPSIGIKNEAGIREQATRANIHRRRIFTFGVGYDVNAPLLNGIAAESKGTSTFAFPSDSIAMKIEELFSRLSGPIFSDITLTVTTPDGKDASGLVSDFLPTTINDLFNGDRLTLLGNYRTNAPLLFTLRGNYLGSERTFSFTFDPINDRDSTAPWIYRLWAGRKIADNVLRISEAGSVPREKRDDTAWTELKRMTEEIVRLSRANGIISEYTDYLAFPTTDVEDMKELLRIAESRLEIRAQNSRTGMGAISQAINNGAAINGTQSNRTNTYLDEDLQVVEVTSVQQIHDLTFFHRTYFWEDSLTADTTKKQEGPVFSRAQPSSNDVLMRSEELEEKTQHPSEEEASFIMEKDEIIEESNIAAPDPARLHFGRGWVDARILDSAGTQRPERTVKFGTEEYNRLLDELIATQRQGILALEGDILLLHDGKTVLISR